MYACGWLYRRPLSKRVNSVESLKLTESIDSKIPTFNEKVLQFWPFRWFRVRGHLQDYARLRIRTNIKFEFEFEKSK